MTAPMGPHHGYSNELVKEVDEILNQNWDTVGVKTVWKAVLEVLRREKITYLVLRAHCKLFLVHPMNRGGLMLNPFNVHRNGQRIKSVGADRGELIAAFAIELFPIGSAHRAEQMQKNLDLIKRSHGLLAPMSGEERFLTVGTGHTCGFCRAANHGCKTSEAKLQDTNGCLNAAALKHGDDEMTAMLDEGWDFEIIPWSCECAWPKLAKCAEKALNASNSVPSLPSELEVGCNIAEFAQQMGPDADWNACAAAAAATMPPCVAYIDTIKDLARIYGGGPSMPTLRFLHEFAGSFAENVRLGGVFLEAVIKASFPNKTRMYVLLKAALIATNLTSQKLEDDLAKLLTKSDVQRLCSKSLTASVNKAEDMFEEAAMLVSKFRSDNKLTRDSEVDIVGRFWIRTVLHITLKEKQGFESRRFKDFGEIRALFLSDLSALIGEDPISGTAIDPVVCPTVNVAATSVGTNALTSMELSTPTYIASQSGMKVGDTVIEKKMSGADRLLLTVKKIDKVVELHEMSLFEKKSIVVKINLDNFIADFSKYKGEVQSLVPMDWSLKHSMLHSSNCFLDNCKTQVVRAMKSHDAAHGGPSMSLALTRTPDNVYTTSSVAKGALQLIPVALTTLLSSKASATLASHSKVSVTTQSPTVVFYMQAPPKPPSDPATAWKDEVVISTFHWVNGTPDQSAANMKLNIVTVDGVEFPVLVNTMALQKHTKLQYFKPKQVTTAYSNAVSVSRLEPQKESPKKKARTRN